MFLENGRRIPDTQAGRAYVQAAKTVEDSLSAFLNENLIDDASSSVDVFEIDGAYRAWCAEHSHRGASDVLMALRDRYGPRVVNEEGRNYVAGAKLKTRSPWG